MNIKRFCPKGHDKNIVGRTKLNYCKACHIAGVREWQAANPQGVKINRRNRQWRDADILNADGSRFTHVDYDRHYQTQQGCCLGCLRHQSELNHRLYADHNHRTKHFRFLLCRDCNNVLGHARDTSSTLHRLALALEAMEQDV